jgi:hypothetical protein
MAKKRVHEIAKAQGLTSKELLAGLKAAGVEVKSAQSSVEESVALAALGRTESLPKRTAGDALPPSPNRKGGWYPDPEGSGRLRFWDKKRWTDEFRDAPGGAKTSSSGPAEPSGSGGSGSAPEPPKKRGQWGPAPWWAWLLAGFVALVIISAIAGGDESSNDNGSNDTATKAAQQVTPEQTTASEQATTQASCGTEATDDCTPDVGSNGSVRVDALIWKVTGARTATTLGDTQYGLGAKADGTFVVVDIQVQSDKNESATLTEPFQLDIGGNTYDPDDEGTVAAIGAGDEPLFIEDVGPDATVSGPVVFDVPTDVLNKSAQPKMRFNELGFGTSHAYIALPPL